MFSAAVEAIKITWVTLVGLLWVNIPIIPIMMTPMILLGIFPLLLISSQVLSLLVTFPCLLIGAYIGFRLAWGYWARTVPRWRLWAYPRVKNIRRLRKVAVLVGLIWPDDHEYEATEVRTKKMDQEIKEWEDRK